MDEICLSMTHGKLLCRAVVLNSLEKYETMRPENQTIWIGSNF